ncbi:hypothetical protein GCM10009847_10380 [Leucobacter tardus]|uniref:Uncharacterized protein n=1 Tax=Leucobacter tardus TaxID=501483 RepID=A0A939QCG0_9MICO|nr:hypothetical protein [Leucobacter tardus]MBO2989236.1 hypothetical protein [Leucobacter tardus]
MAHSTRFRALWLGLLGGAVLALVAAIAVTIPILSHSSAGPSGQRLPENFAAESQAEGADGRTRVLQVQDSTGSPADLTALTPGETLTVRGTGFDAGIGIYVSVCAIPETGEKPTPCLGGIPEGAETGGAEGTDQALTSVWITDDWAWRAFATQRYDEATTGAFTARLTVPLAADDGLDCREQRCAITTRADHTAARDRVQDMQLPVAFR